MKNILFIVFIAFVFVSCEERTKDEIQLEELRSQAEQNILSTVSDSSAAEERLRKAYIIGTSSKYYPSENYVRNGHLFFGYLALFKDGVTGGNANWLVHDPDCPKCRAR